MRRSCKTPHQKRRRGQREDSGGKHAPGQRNSLLHPELQAQPLPNPPPDLRAGATPPAQTTNAYIQKVIAAGGFGRYERNHLNALAATFAPHFAHLPPEIVRLVVEYAFHAGYY